MYWFTIFFYSPEYFCGKQYPLYSGAAIFKVEPRISQDYNLLWSSSETLRTLSMLIYLPGSIHYLDHPLQTKTRTVLQLVEKRPVLGQLISWIILDLLHNLTHYKIWLSEASVSHSFCSRKWINFLISRLYKNCFL